jgi:hypothetical protein
MAGLRGRATYSPRDIEFLVAHLVPLDVWYLLPVEDCIPGPMLRFYRHRKAKEMRLEQSSTLHSFECSLVTNKSG